jgi:hypothetical protein
VSRRPRDGLCGLEQILEHEGIPIDRVLEPTPLPRANQRDAGSRLSTCLEVAGIVSDEHRRVGADPRIPDGAANEPGLGFATFAALVGRMGTDIEPDELDAATPKVALHVIVYRRDLVGGNDTPADSGLIGRNGDEKAILRQ